MQIQFGIGSCAAAMHGTGGFQAFGQFRPSAIAMLTMRVMLANMK
jgi:hypothetical protein